MKYTAVGLIIVITHFIGYFANAVYITYRLWNVGFCEIFHLSCHHLSFIILCNYRPQSHRFTLIPSVLASVWSHYIRCSVSCQIVYHRTDSRFAPSQWETALLCNDVSHWLGANLASALYHHGGKYGPSPIYIWYTELAANANISSASDYSMFLEKWRNGICISTNFRKQEIIDNVAQTSLI